jgi:hypothetical protein
VKEKQILFATPMVHANGGKAMIFFTRYRNIFLRYQHGGRGVIYCQYYQGQVNTL